MDWAAGGAERGAVHRPDAGAGALGRRRRRRDQRRPPRHPGTRPPPRPPAVPEAAAKDLTIHRGRARARMSGRAALIRPSRACPSRPVGVQCVRGQRLCPPRRRAALVIIAVLAAGMLAEACAAGEKGRAGWVGSFHCAAGGSRAEVRWRLRRRRFKRTPHVRTCDP
jgi:hypothetical protein